MRFGPIADVAKHYACVENSEEFARFYRPDADDIRERRLQRLGQLSKRKRKTTLRGAMAQANAAGVHISGAIFNPDDSIELKFGHVIARDLLGSPDLVNPWDEVLK